MVVYCLTFLLEVIPKDVWQRFINALLKDIVYLKDLRKLTLDLAGNDIQKYIQGVSYTFFYYFLNPLYPRLIDSTITSSLLL